MIPRPVRQPLVVLGLLLAPLVASAVTLNFECGATHYLRLAGTEIVSSTFSVRNADPANPATILRLTLRDGLGQVVHDSGPAVGTALPLNTDFPQTFPAGRDVTQVPPGGGVYLRTNHLFGNGSLPAAAGGNEAGQLMSATLVVAKEGNRQLLSVHTTQRMRVRATTAIGATEAETRASGTEACQAQPALP